MVQISPKGFEVARKQQHEFSKAKLAPQGQGCRQELHQLLRQDCLVGHPARWGLVPVGVLTTQ
jgi:hypothetical protein